jgi:phosphinothricin acetyltransferase
MQLAARIATPDDAPAIARIYNEGIADRVGTFETMERTAADVRGWFDETHPIVVVTAGDARVVAFASTSSYRSRPCYGGVAEFSVYVARDWRGRGAGREAMTALLAAARAAGYWKLVSRVFPENAASRRLLHTLGFREVGVYERHARLDGRWRDVVIVERQIPENQADEATVEHASPATLRG